MSNHQDSLSALLEKRHSVRDFLPDPIPEALILSLLEQALKSPSWSNTQPYRVAIATGATRDRLAHEYSTKFAKASALRGKPRWWQAIEAWRRGVLPDGDHPPVLQYPADLQARRAATGFGLYHHLGIARDDYAARDAQMARNYTFFDAPAVLFLFAHEGLGVFSALDAGIFLQSLILLATEAGLGTCAQGALAVWRSPLDELFEIPAQYGLLCGLALGYESTARVNAYQPDRSSVAAICLPLKA